MRTIPFDIDKITANNVFTRSGKRVRIYDTNVTVKIDDCNYYNSIIAGIIYYDGTTAVTLFDKTGRRILALGCNRLTSSLDDMYLVLKATDRYHITQLSKDPNCYSVFDNDKKTNAIIAVFYVRDEAQQYVDFLNSKDDETNNKSKTKKESGDPDYCD